MNTEALCWRSSNSGGRPNESGDARHRDMVELGGPYATAIALDDAPRGRAVVLGILPRIVRARRQPRPVKNACARRPDMGILNRDLEDIEALQGSRST